MNQKNQLYKKLYITLLILVVFLLGCTSKRENGDFLNKKYPLQEPKIKTVIDLDTFQNIIEKEPTIIWNNEFVNNKKNKNDQTKNTKIITEIMSFQPGPDSTFLILDKNSRIIKMSRAGEWLGTIGEAGSGPGEFIAPRYMVYANDKIFIPDLKNGRLEILDKDGNYLKQIDKFQMANIRHHFAVSRNDDIIARTSMGDSMLLAVYDNVGHIYKFGNYEQSGFNLSQQTVFNDMFIIYVLLQLKLEL